MVHKYHAFEENIISDDGCHFDNRINLIHLLLSYDIFDFFDNESPRFTYKSSLLVILVNIVRDTKLPFRHAAAWSRFD